MIPRKPYVKKPLIHSERGLEVLRTRRSFLIKTLTNDGANVIHRQVQISDAGQCLAALTLAKEKNVRCLVYAVGEAFGEECLEIVDEDYLREALREES